MLFNSINFAFFLPVVFVLYWLVTNKNLKLQNLVLLISSYFFYSCWDWRFLFLLVFSTFLDFYTGIKIAETKNLIYKKIWFWLSIIVNLGFLGVFKYYNFFIESFNSVVSNFGLHIDSWSMKFILPVGISFYTFHGLSYVIDIYKGRIKAERNYIDYSVFVSFFPLLVAGPIERATHLLPQIQQNRVFDYSKIVDGLRQILWGLFKKVVIADQCANYANMIFNNPSDYSGSTLFLGAFLFAIQIYGDFSGYSDIALGTARLFGIELLRNFSYPYFSRDIAEFWRRWHISLSSWFRDYLYIPLGGSKGGIWMKVRNTFVIFIISGFWHGANWTFIIWGFLNALYIMPSIIYNTNRNNLDIVAKGRVFPTLKDFCLICLTFSLTTFAWVFFRAKNVSSAFEFIINMCNPTFFRLPSIRPTNLFIILICFILIEWFAREKKHGLQFNHRITKPFRVIIYLLLSYFILFNLKFHDKSDFIYFQF